VLLVSAPISPIRGCQGRAPGATASTLPPWRILPRNRSRPSVSSLQIAGGGFYGYRVQLTFIQSHLPGLTRLDPAIHLCAKKMDPRVKAPRG